MARAATGARGVLRGHMAGWSGCCTRSCTTGPGGRDAVQDAFASALVRWPVARLPRPRGAGATVAFRRPSTITAAPPGSGGPCCGLGRCHRCRRSMPSTSTWSGLGKLLPPSGRCWSPPCRRAGGDRVTAPSCMPVGTVKSRLAWDGRRLPTSRNPASAPQTRRAPMRRAVRACRPWPRPVGWPAPSARRRSAAAPLQAPGRDRAGPAALAGAVGACGWPPRGGWTAQHRPGRAGRAALRLPAGRSAPASWARSATAAAADQIIDASTGRVLRQVPGTDRQTDQVADAVVGPDLRSLYLPAAGPSAASTVTAAGPRSTWPPSPAARLRGPTGVGEFSLSADGQTLAYLHTSAPFGDGPDAVPVPHRAGRA